MGAPQPHKATEAREEGHRHYRPRRPATGKNLRPSPQAKNRTAHQRRQGQTTASPVWSQAPKSTHRPKTLRPRSTALGGLRHARAATAPHVRTRRHVDSPWLRTRRKVNHTRASSRRQAPKSTHLPQGRPCDRGLQPWEASGTQEPPRRLTSVPVGVSVHPGSRRGAEPTAARGVRAGSAGSDPCHPRK